MWPLPISPSRFSTGTLQSFRISGQVDEPRMPSLCSSAPTEKPGEVFLDEKRGELFAVDLGEHGEQVGEAGVGDPHLFAVENVVLAVGREQRRACGSSSRRSRWCSPTARRRRPFPPVASLGRYFFFCSSVPNQTSGSVPMPLCAPRSMQSRRTWPCGRRSWRTVTLSISKPPYASGISTRSVPVLPLSSPARVKSNNLCARFSRR